MSRMDKDQQEERLEKQGLPDGEEDRDPQTAEQRKMLAVIVDFSYLIVLFIALVVIAILVATR